MEQVQDKVYIEISESFARYVTTLFYLAFSVLLFYLSGQIRVTTNVWVPFTMQPFAVILVALAYPKNLAILSQCIIYTLVLAGVPLLSHTGVGSAVFLAPTSGYLLGFYMATVFLAHSEPYRRAQPWSVWFVWVMLAQVLIWLSGVVWLSQFSGVVDAVLMGFVPFVIPDIGKAALAVFAARGLLAQRG